MRWLYRLSDFHRQHNNENKMGRKKVEQPFFPHHFVWNEAHIISNENLRYRYTGDCSACWLIAKLSPLLTPCRRVTKRDKMAYGKDLTFQRSLLSSLPLFWKLQEPSSKGNTAPVKSGTVFFKIQHVLNVAFWASGLCERLCLIYGALNLQHVSFGPETQSTVNPTLLSLRRCNSHTSTCHLCWQAAYLEKSIRYPASVTPPQAFQKQTAKAANLY